jgi:UDP-N-acetylmuramoyl-tripeptide--D-alanyl-D-alanine ligase
VIRLTLQQVADAVNGEGVAGPTLDIAGVSTDSRRLEPGDLFVALRGEHGDGHDWIAAAVEAGAAAVMVERDVDVPDAVGIVHVPDTWTALLDLGGHVRDVVDPTTVAVTGSVGKTTTKDLAAGALRTGRRTVAASGSFNNELGVPLTMLDLAADTEVLLTEVGARSPGDIARLAERIRPDVAVVTSVAPVHLELFGTIQAVAATKGELVAALAPGGAAVLNADDELVMAMTGRAVGIDVIDYGESPSAMVHMLDIALDEQARPTAKLVTPWGDVEVSVPVAGRHNAWNAAAAVAVAGVVGLDVAAAAEGIAASAVSPWRGEVVDVAGIRFLNDAYNANPVAMRAALATLDALATGRRVAVLGLMAEVGSGHDAQHRGVGNAVPGNADVLVVVGEDAVGIAIGAEDAGMDVTTIHEVADTDRAMSILAELLEPGDTVLVKASRVGGLERLVSGWQQRLGDEAS